MLEAVLAGVVPTVFMVVLYVRGQVVLAIVGQVFGDAHAWLSTAVAMSQLSLVTWLGLASAGAALQAALLLATTLLLIHRRPT